MRYFRKLFIGIALSLILIQTAFAFYNTKWVTVFEDKNTNPKGINYVMLDEDSVNIHNNSVYYAIRYGYRNDKNFNSYVSIIQNKNGQVGIVETYEYGKYDEIMQDNIHNPHPAYKAKEAKNFKTIDTTSFMYFANEMAKYIVIIKGKNPEPATMGLYNKLYGD